jgi:hypothetical protein
MATDIKRGDIIKTKNAETIKLEYRCKTGVVVSDPIDGLFMARLEDIPGYCGFYSDEVDKIELGAAIEAIEQLKRALTDLSEHILKVIGVLK